MSELGEGEFYEASVNLSSFFIFSILFFRTHPRVGPEYFIIKKDPGSAQKLLDTGRIFLRV